jgi:hypothetical protein
VILIGLNSKETNITKRENPKSWMLYLALAADTAISVCFLASYLMLWALSPPLFKEKKYLPLLCLSRVFFSSTEQNREEWDIPSYLKQIIPHVYVC